MGFRQRRVAPVNVTDDIGVCLEHHVFIDEPRARDRGPASVNGALNAVFARPRHHFLSLFARFD